MTATHDSFLDHPIVHAYVSLRVWGSLVKHSDVVTAEIRARTEPGARVLSISCRGNHAEVELAAALPDRHFDVVVSRPERARTARAMAEERGLGNLRFTAGDPNDLRLEPGIYDALLALYSMHRVEKLERCWAACHRALRPGGVVLAQDYVGPNAMQWPPARARAASDALDQLVPAIHKTHHAVVGSALAEQLTREEEGLAARSQDILPTCRAAGFDVVAVVGAGCALLHPVLTRQIDSYDPLNWEHNHVLSSLCREEARLMDEGVLGDDFAMFIATRGDGEGC